MASRNYIEQCLPIIAESAVRHQWLRGTARDPLLLKQNELGNVVEDEARETVKG